MGLVSVSVVDAAGEIWRGGLCVNDGLFIVVCWSGSAYVVFDAEGSVFPFWRRRGGEEVAEFGWEGQEVWSGSWGGQWI